MLSQDNLRLAAAGDSIITRGTINELPETPDAFKAIGSADVSFTNLEILLHDYEGYPAAVGPGTRMRAPPSVADELQTAGFDMFSIANNHIMDYSHGGMKATMRELSKRNMVFAGLGENLAEAREPAYLDTNAGRVALIACCSTIVPGSEAGAQRPDMHGRPGLAPLRLETTHIVSQKGLNKLKDISKEIGFERIKSKNKQLGGVHEFKADDGDVFKLLNLGVGGQPHMKFEVGDEPGVKQTPVQSDIDAIQKQIRIARANADWVLLSLHAHEGENGDLNDQTIAPFIKEFSRDCISEGADAVLCHGPHVIRGVEIYEGSPIFYSLGNTFFEIETISRFPAGLYDWYGLDHQATPLDLMQRKGQDENGEPTGFLKVDQYWEGIIPVCDYDGGEVRKITVYPLDLGKGRPRSQRGTPLDAEEQKKSKILSELQELSNEFDTSIVIEDDIGVIYP